MNTTHYFAYGSNLCLTQFERRCPGHRIVGRAIAHGYRLAFPRFARGWTSAVAGILPDAQQHVEGAVYAINDDHIRTLDVYEGIAEGYYVRGRVNVRLEAGDEMEVMTYFANPQDGANLPSKKYLQTILNGARDHRLSQGWIGMLESLLVELDAAGPTTRAPSSPT